MPDIPGVFISSTFYDLHQVRTDLIHFVENQLGYRALASELASFPIEPGLDTIENCRRRVDEQADIFILVVGGRYGPVSETHGKSVTNLEYLAARAKGIPIYAFVERDVLAVLTTWQANPNADFSSTVDTPELFDFLERLRSGDRVWMFPFSTAQEIIQVLRTQFAYLMGHGLAVLSKLQGQQLELRSLTGKALQLAIERPLGWQGKLCAQVLFDEIDGMRDLRRAHDRGIALGAGERVSDGDVPGWIASHLGRATRLTESLSRVINETLKQVINTDDVSVISYASRQLAAGYREALEWAGVVRKASLPKEWESLGREMALILDNFIKALEQVGPELVRHVDEMILRPPEEREEIVLEILFELANWERFNEEVERMERHYGAL